MQNNTIAKANNKNISQLRHIGVKFFLAFIVLVLSSCSSLNIKKNLSLSVSKPVRENLAFTGKGAGAGMMLMSSMGPMGIAIGVAIDEGIAKDIAKAVKDKPFDIRQQMVDAFRTELSDEYTVTVHDENSVKSKKTELAITLKKFGFKSQPGEGDLVSAWFEIKINYLGDETDWVYPDNYFNQDEAIPVISLEMAKSDGSQGRELLQQALELIASQWLATRSSS